MTDPAPDAARAGATRAFKCDVLRIEGGMIAEITTFGWSRFASFGLPDALSPQDP